MLEQKKMMPKRFMWLVKIAFLENRISSCHKFICEYHDWHALARRTKKIIIKIQSFIFLLFYEHRRRERELERKGSLTRTCTAIIITFNCTTIIRLLLLNNFSSWRILKIHRCCSKLLGS